MLLIGQPVGCQNIVFLIKIREKGYSEIILNALEVWLKFCG